MNHPAASASSLPSLMMPCPNCAGRMVYHGRSSIGPDVEDTVYACRRCGAELIRTSMRNTATTKSDGNQAAEAA
jgi:DNA-directed RNA polymerase subunit RPC12/RpoP